MGNRSSSKAPPRHDLILGITGSFGKYQFWLCVLLFYCKFAIASHHMAIIFHAPKVTYDCHDSPTLDEAARRNKCPCSKPIFDKTEFSNTLQMEYNLICEKKWLANFTQTIFQLGSLIGSIFFGMASDAWGRRKPFLAACVLQVVFGLSAVVIKSYVLFILARFIIGFSVGGTMVISFVILMEFIGPEYREVVVATYTVPFNLGHLMLPFFAYFLRDYKYFQFAISAPQILFIIYFFTVPETPRWLIAMKKTERAIVKLEKVARINKRPTDHVRQDVLAYQALAEQHALKKGTIADLFRTPNIRKNNLAMAFNWLTCSYVFYGVSQYVGHLSGNVFVNVASTATVTLLGTVASIPLMQAMGRKTMILLCHTICSICLFILAFVSDRILSIICACIGTVTSFIIFVVVYLYCGELFPTVVRNAAVGFSSMAARIGAMVAPFIIDLGDFARWLPAVGFAIVPFVAFFVTLILPETKGCELTTTIEEGEEFYNRKKTPKT